MINNKLKKLKHRNEKSEIKKAYLKRFFYFIFGLVLIAFVWEDKSILRFLGIIGLVISLAQFVAMFAMLQPLLDEYFPPKTYDKNKVMFIDKFLYVFSMVLFLGGLIFEIFQIRIIDNTIGGLNLFWKSGLIGSIVGLLITFCLKKISPTVYDESDRRISILFGFILGSFIFSTALASFINSHFATENVSCEDYFINSKSIGGKRDKSSWLFLKTSDNSEERFDVSRSLYLSVNEGGQVKLCSRMGKFGYPVVQEFKTIGNGE